MSAPRPRDLALAIIARHPYPGADAGAVADLLESCPRLTVRDGEPVCREGAPGDSMFFLLSGEVSVRKGGADGLEHDLGRIRGPALFGHMALADHSRRSASCIAVGNVLLAVCDEKRYGRLLRDRGRIGTTLRRLLLASLASQLDQGNQRLRQLLEPVSHPSRQPAALAGPDQDELLRTAGLLEGWKVDTSGLDGIELVIDEDARRNPRGRRRGGP